MKNSIPEFTGELDTIFSLSEICERCGMHAELVTEMVEFGIVAPLESSSTRWQFSAASLYRLRRAQRLRHDLELNLQGLALSLELLDEIDTLKQEVAALRQRLQAFHD